MKVRRFYRPGAVYAAPTESLRDAARKMRRAGLSCLAVVHDGAVVAIFTERDLVEATAAGAQPALTHVNDYMNDGSVTVTLDDDSSAAQLKMLAIGCGHLPVVDGGRLVGMISARDLFLAQAGADGRPAERALAGAAAGRPGDWPEEAPPDVDSEA